jgi:hypothetical protein
MLGLLFLLLPLIVAGCGKTYEFESTWRERTITVDGNNEDWEGITSYVDAAKISVGLLNDENYLYVNLVLWEPMQQMQAMGQGLTLWFDPEGGDEKTLGIRYPLGGMGGMMRPGRGGQDRDEMREEMRENYLAAATELELLGPRDIDRHRYDLAEAHGVEVRVNPTKESLIYELKVPLTKSAQEKFALGADGGEPIGVTLETPKTERPEMSGGFPGGGGGRSGGGGRGGGRMPGGGRRSPPEPLEVQAKIRLATAAAPR